MIQTLARPPATPTRSKEPSLACWGLRIQIGLIASPASQFRLLAPRKLKEISNFSSSNSMTGVMSLSAPPTSSLTVSQTPTATSPIVDSTTIEVVVTHTSNYANC